VTDRPAASSIGAGTQEPEHTITAMAGDIWMTPVPSPAPGAGVPPRADSPDPLAIDGGPGERPRRPESRRSKVGMALAAALVIAAAFAAGVFADSHWGSSTANAATTGSGFRGRFGSAGGAGAGGPGTAPAGGFGGRFGAGVVGRVVAVNGSTITVQTVDGATVQVEAASARVNRTEPTTVTGVTPGDNIVVAGAIGADGTVSAATVTVSDAPLGGRFGPGVAGAGQGAGRSPATTVVTR